MAASFRKVTTLRGLTKQALNGVKCQRAGVATGAEGQKSWSRAQKILAGLAGAATTGAVGIGASLQFAGLYTNFNQHLLQ